jgi:gluconokinase
LVKQIPWFLGIDLGTSGCKATIVDETGHPVALGSVGYPAGDSSQRWKEQDPDVLIQAMVDAVRSAMQEAGLDSSACAGLSLAGAMHSLVALDGHGEPLTGVITWADNRGSSQAEAVKARHDIVELYQRTGCPAHPMYPLYKIIWLRDEQPDTFRRAARFVSAKEYVTHKLLGEYVVDYSIASGSGLLDISTLDWSSESLSLANIEPRRLSRLGDPSELFHGLNPSLAEEMGLDAGTPVVLGSSDAVNSNLGAGAVHPYQATCMIGTSGAFRIVADQPLLDRRGRTWCYAIDPKHWLVGGAINNGGIAVSWWQDSLNRVLEYTGSQTKFSLEDVSGLAAQAGAGAGGLMCLPFLAGERSPFWRANASALFFGATLEHNLCHFSRALLEGVAYRMRSISEILTELAGAISEVRASGGFTRSEIWPQIVSSVLKIDLTAPRFGDTSSLAAAYWGMRGVGILPSIESMKEMVAIGEIFHPVASDSALYDQLYAMYCDLCTAVSPFYDASASLRAQLLGG